jgi:hypothetical protein
VTELDDLLTACAAVAKDSHAARSTKGMAAALAKWAPTAQPLAPAPVVLFHDDFDGPAGAPPDPAKWWPTPWCSTSADDAEGCYNPANAYQDGNGNLVLAVTPGTMGRPYDFARVQSFQEGGWPPPHVLWAHGPAIRVEARIRFAPGVGLWGGFWLMGCDPTTPLELDVQEFRGAVPTQVAIHTHGPVYGSLKPFDTRADLSADFHVYWTEYQATGATFGIDSTTIGQLPTPAQALGVRLSHTVGPPGSWGGQMGPPPASALPAHMLVDYVKVTAL